MYTVPFLYSPRDPAHCSDSKPGAFTQDEFSPHCNALALLVAPSHCHTFLHSTCASMPSAPVLNNQSHHPRARNPRAHAPFAPNTMATAPLVRQTKTSTTDAATVRRACRPHTCRQLALRRPCACSRLPSPPPHAPSQAGAVTVRPSATVAPRPAAGRRPAGAGPATPPFRGLWGALAGVAAAQGGRACRNRAQQVHTPPSPYGHSGEGRVGRRCGTGGCPHDLV